LQTSSMSMSVRMIYFSFSIQTCEKLNNKGWQITGVFCSMLHA
jgi:hypothetical protein